MKFRSEGKEFSSFFKLSRPAPYASQPPIQRLLGTVIHTIKRPGREAAHSPSVQVRRQELVELYMHSHKNVHIDTVPLTNVYVPILNKRDGFGKTKGMLNWAVINMYVKFYTAGNHMVQTHRCDSSSQILSLTNVYLPILNKRDGFGKAKGMLNWAVINMYVKLYTAGNHMVQTHRCDSSSQILSLTNVYVPILNKRDGFGKTKGMLNWTIINMYVKCYTAANHMVQTHRCDISSQILYLTNVYVPILNKRDGFGKTKGMLNWAVINIYVKYYTAGNHMVQTHRCDNSFQIFSTLKMGYSENLRH